MLKFIILNMLHHKKIYNLLSAANIIYLHIKYMFKNHYLNYAIILKTKSISRPKPDKHTN